MNKKEIIQNLEDKHQAFILYINGLSQEEFEYAIPDKWSAGQQLEHIIKSVKPLNQGFMLPNFMLKMIFGTTNRPSRTYDDVFTKYHQKLEAGGRATSRFIPKEVPFTSKKKLILTLEKQIKKLGKQVNAFSENDLDYLIAPHPLLGKLTLRELLYFTIFHVEHHQLLIEKYLKERG